MRDKYVIAHLIAILIGLILLVFIARGLVKKYDQSKSYSDNQVEATNITSEKETDGDLSFEADSKNVKKFQDKYSMDWDFIDAGYLLKISEYYGGTKEDRAYTILVTLNRVFADRKPIKDVVLEELYNNAGLDAYEFEAIVPSKETKEAMEMILYEHFDNSSGSLEYKKHD